MSDVSNAVVAMFRIGRDDDGGYWLIVTVDGRPHDQAGPFETEDQAVAARDDLMRLGRECGGVDMPAGGH